MKSRRTEHIALRQKLAYSAPALALAVVGIPVYVYIPKFYTDVVGINIAVLGTILFSVRIFDAVADPAIGYISDPDPNPIWQAPTLYCHRIAVCRVEHVFAV